MALPLVGTTALGRPTPAAAEVSAEGERLQPPALLWVPLRVVGDTKVREILGRVDDPGRKETASIARGSRVGQSLRTDPISTEKTIMKEDGP